MTNFGSSRASFCQTKHEVQNVIGGGQNDETCNFSFACIGHVNVLVD